MIIQVGLILVLLILALYALAQRSRTPVVAGLIFCSVLVGIGLVLFPGLATRLANFVGVGRGADLIFYLFIVIALAAIFNLHLQIRANKEMVTELVRSLALLSARDPSRE